MLDQFKNWFNLLPVKYQNDLASEIVLRMGQIQVNVYHRLFLQDFMQKLQSVIKNEVDKTQFFSMICDLIAQKMRENEGWEEQNRAMQQEAALTGSCSVASAAAQNEQQYLQWRDISKRWEDFINN